jgi:hypothetical protein
MSPGETAARLTVKDVERHRTDDVWEGDNGEQVGRPGGEPTEERAQKCIGTPADRGLVMCLMAYAERTLIYTLHLYFVTSAFKMNTDVNCFNRNTVICHTSMADSVLVRAHPARQKIKTCGYDISDIHTWNV